MNLNELAKEITLKEGLKESISIAQVKEVLGIILKDEKIRTEVHKAILQSILKSIQ